MKKYIIGIALFCAFTANVANVANAVAQQQKFKIDGTAPASLEGRMIYLDYTSNDMQLSDSIRIESGRFSFTGSVEEPVYVRLVLDDVGQGKMKAQYIGDRLYFYLGNEQYAMEIQDSLAKARVYGSPLHEEYTHYLQEIGGCFMKLMDEAGKAFAQVDSRSEHAAATYEKLKTKYDSRLAERRVKELAFAKANPNSIFALDALLDVANAYPLSEVEPVFKALAASVRETGKGKH